LRLHEAKKAMEENGVQKSLEDLLGRVPVQDLDVTSKLSTTMHTGSRTRSMVIVG
jgi:hypothetical protein